MPLPRRFHLGIFAGLITVGLPSTLRASLCLEHSWTLSEIAGAPVLVTGRVVSLKMANGPHFTGDPKQSAPAQMMTAEVEVLRSSQQRTEKGTAPSGILTIRFLGRDGPDFSPCSLALPKLEPGQVLLLPLRSKLKGQAEPWKLIGDDGNGMTMLAAPKMGEQAVAMGDSRAFIIREVANNFRRGDPLTLFAAAELVASQDDYLEPELLVQLQKSIGRDRKRWAQILGNILLTCREGSLTVEKVQTDKAAFERRRFEGFSLAKLALSHLSDATTSETLVWRSLLADIPGFAAGPDNTLFSYGDRSPSHVAELYLVRYRNNPAFIKAVKLALRENLPGSSALASALIRDGQKVFVPEALGRAMKVLPNPDAYGDDVMASIHLVRRYGTDDQRRQIAALVPELRATNPDYANYLQRQLTIY